MHIRITDIQRFCLHDGPGIRTTVFFQGCPLRCEWCQNPECLTPQTVLRFTAARCIGCGLCVKACPNQVHLLTADSHKLERSRCVVCGRCAAICPTGTLGVVGEEWTPAQVFAVVCRDRDFYYASGGGVTLSGGEPLLQAEGARAILHLARSEGIHTAIETCGCVEWSAVASVLGLVNLWLFDLKHLEADIHQRLTGLSNDLALGNLEQLLSAGEQIILRLPVIPGRNDGAWLEEALPRWLRARRQVLEVHLMPYHRLAESKYAGLGLDYALAGLAAPSAEKLEELKSRLEATGVQVRVGG